MVRACECAPSPAGPSMSAPRTASAAAPAARPMTCRRGEYCDPPIAMTQARELRDFLGEILLRRVLDRLVRALHGWPRVDRVEPALDVGIIVERDPFVLGVAQPNVVGDVGNRI